MPILPLIYILDLEKYAIRQNEGKLQLFNFERDADNWVDIFVREFDLERDEVKEQLLTITQSENLLRHVVLYDNGLLVGTGAIALKKDSKNGRLVAIYASNIQYLKEILDGLCRYSKEKSITKLAISFTHLMSDSEKISPYEELGFEKVELFPSEIE